MQSEKWNVNLNGRSFPQSAPLTQATPSACNITLNRTTEEYLCSFPVCVHANVSLQVCQVAKCPSSAVCRWGVLCLESGGRLETVPSHNSIRTPAVLGQLSAHEHQCWTPEVGDSDGDNIGQGSQWSCRYRSIVSAIRTPRCRGGTCQETWFR